jgi:hypothetical protein
MDKDMPCAMYMLEAVSVMRYALCVGEKGNKRKRELEEEGEGRRRPEGGN